MEATSFSVKTATFEGPLEALLRLIEDRKLFINEISLARVTDDYIAYIKSLQSLNFAETTGFLVVAATLLLIKSKSLLPNISLTEDEKGSIDDLEYRLKMYQTIKKVGVHIKEKFGKEMIFMGVACQQPVIFTPDPSITKDSLLSALNNVIEAMPKNDIVPQIEVKKVISIEEMINNLIERVQEGIKLSFKEFSKGSTLENIKEEKVNIIVSFLAVLELTRQGIIDVVQNESFDDIDIVKSS